MAALATAVGASSDVLLRNTIDVKQTLVLFRGERLSKKFLSPRAARFCPACLAEDGANASWRHRLIWGVRHVHRCGRHGLWLEASSDPSAISLSSAARPSDPAARQPVSEPEPDYLKWLSARLHGNLATVGSWMEGQTLEQILNASEMLGAILEHGHQIRVTKLPPAESEEATDIGFAIYREGPRAVAEALDTIRQTSPAKAVQAGPLAYYGRLFDWLDRRSNGIDPGPIKRILRDHIVKHSAVEPGTTVLGVEITERRFHTLQSLSAEVGVDRKRLSRLLQKIGKVPAGASDAESGNLVFDAHETIPLIEAFQTAVRLHDVPAYLGGSQGQIKALYRAGILKPFVPSTGRGSVRNVVFARAHLDEIHEKLDRLPVISGAECAGLHPVAYACQRGAGPFEQVFARILAGDIPSRRRSGKTGIGQLLINPNDVLDQRPPT